MTKTVVESNSMSTHRILILSIDLQDSFFRRKAFKKSILEVDMGPDITIGSRHQVNGEVPTDCFI